MEIAEKQAVADVFCKRYGKLCRLVAGSAARSPIQRQKGFLNFILPDPPTKPIRL